MKRPLLLVLLVGCGPKVPAFAEPPPGHGSAHARQQEQRQQQAPPPDDPIDRTRPPDGKSDCVVEFTFPTEGHVGRYPSYEVVATPPIPFHGSGAEPTAIIRIVAPNGKVDEQVMPLVNQPVCAYCLPAKGSSGCDHDCRWEPFEGNVGSIYIETTGPYRVTVRLQNSPCELRGDRAVVEGVPLPK